MLFHSWPPRRCDCRALHHLAHATAYLVGLLLLFAAAVSLGRVFINRGGA